MKAYVRNGTETAEVIITTPSGFMLAVPMPGQVRELAQQIADAINGSSAMDRVEGLARLRAENESLKAEIKETIGRLAHQTAATNERGEACERAKAYGSRAANTLTKAGYIDSGGELWKPPVGKPAGPLLDALDTLRGEMAVQDSLHAEELLQVRKCLAAAETDLRKLRELMRRDNLKMSNDNRTLQMKLAAAEGEVKQLRGYVKADNERADRDKLELSNHLKDAMRDRDRCIGHIVKLSMAMQQAEDDVNAVDAKAKEAPQESMVIGGVQIVKAESILDQVTAAVEGIITKHSKCQCRMCSKS